MVAPSASSFPEVRFLPCYKSAYCRVFSSSHTCGRSKEVAAPSAAWAPSVRSSWKVQPWRPAACRSSSRTRSSCPSAQLCNIFRDHCCLESRYKRSCSHGAPPPAIAAPTPAAAAPLHDCKGTHEGTMSTKIELMCSCETRPTACCQRVPNPQQLPLYAQH